VGGVRGLLERLFLGWLGRAMAGSRRWFVESKDFELLVKGGVLGVRLYERSNGKQRLIFLQKHELAWLVHIVEEPVAVESSEVFWDQSRAGYLRVIAQRRSNRHRCFLTVEEFDGRRRCGNILIPEGRYGQGWDQFMLELRKAISSLREVSKGKKDKEVNGRRSYAEVMALTVNPSEECFGSYPEPIARVSGWLKESSAGTNKLAQEAVKPNGALKKNHIPVRLFRGPVGARKGNPKAGVSTGELSTAPASSCKFPVRLAASSSGPELLKGREGAGIHDG
jgi:hypothetical protein